MTKSELKQLAEDIERAVGGSYEMGDGRNFWIDAPVAREITRRVLAHIPVSQNERADVKVFLRRFAESDIGRWLEQRTNTVEMDRFLDSLRDFLADATVSQNEPRESARKKAHAMLDKQINRLIAARKGDRSAAFDGYDHDEAMLGHWMRQAALGEADAQPVTSPSAVRVYLAARYTHSSLMRTRAEILRGVGYDVQAQWITGLHDGVDDETCAHADFEQVRAADIVISFTERPREQSTARGGRHVEFGVALALNKRCIVVGYRENVFHSLPQVEFYESWEDCVSALGREFSDATRRTEER